HVTERISVDICQRQKVIVMWETRRSRLRGSGGTVVAVRCNRSVPTNLNCRGRVLDIDQVGDEDTRLQAVPVVSLRVSAVHAESAERGIASEINKNCLRTHGNCLPD